MNDKIIGSKQAVVEIQSGDITQRFVARLPSYKPGETYLRSWAISDLRKDGCPDRRARGRSVGVSTNYCGALEGQSAFPLNGEAAAQADVARATIRRLGDELHAAKQALLSLYANQQAPL